MGAIWPGALLVGYLAATAILLFAGWTRVSSGGVAIHLGVLAAIAAATWLGIVPRWLRYWAPLLALLFLYTEMPMLIRAAGHQQLFDGTVIRWERALFGAQPALEWSMRWPTPALSEALHLAYLSYYMIIVAIPAALYVTSRHAEFSEAVFALMLTFIACFLFYLVFPVAGPRYSWPTSTAGQGGPVRAVVLWLLETRSSRGTALPSSHVAVATAQSLLAVRYFGSKGLFIAALAAGLALGAVYGGFHYAIDVIAGVVFGVAATVVGVAAFSRLTRGLTPQANATAPT